MVAPLQLAPAPIVQPASGSVWGTAVPGIELDGVGGDAVLRPVAVGLGRALARRHRVPVAGSHLPSAARPWPLLESLPPSMAGGPQRATTRVVLGRLADPVIRRAVRVARDQSRPTHVVHGDIAPGNIVVETSPAGTVRIGLIDVGSGGLGATEYDLVAAAATLNQLSRPGLDLEALCLEAYWAACGPGSLNPAWRCISALMSAWQVALHHGDDRATDVARLLSRATAAAEEVRS
ncbi:aminoglycoside phosphotransferase family protein [Knoellia locipacati]|uniref:phosphotransferase family protein n=1 Tax=Knoellia locipacati TaxID=882824 RepID=UPI00384EB353